VIPDVNVRQYVLAFPFELWGKLAYQPVRVNAAQKIFCDSVQRWYQQRAKEYGFPDGKNGGVAVLHRSGSALNAMPHIHALLLDGVYTGDAVFHPFNPPDAVHLEELCHALSLRALAMLKRHGALEKEEEPGAQLACTQLALFRGDRVGGDEEDAPKFNTGKSARKLCAVPTRTPWAELIGRSFDGADALKCPNCGTRMAVLAVIRDRKEARRYLEGAGEYAELPTQGRSRAPP
jgi:hypothetical protein